MKNSIKFSVLIVLSILITSCKKEYTCVCTSSGSSTSQSIEAISKSQATNLCDALEFDFLGATSECTIR